MKQHLMRLLELNREMARVSSLVADEWSANERYRNDPKRQALTTQLVEALPKPTRLGSVCDDIARRLNIDLD